MSPPKKVLAIASGGGHWIQLMRLKPAFEGHEVAYVSTNHGYSSDVAPARLYVVVDASRWNKVKMLLLTLQTAWILIKERPQVVLSTGAAPGYFGLRFGKLLGARTLWIDSIANAEEVSLSGRLARRHADLWLTQWPGLARPGGPDYRGRVI
jgi:UDP-N-acetylglucosamine:LPS N-acetylglucosamine transferase